MSLAEQQAALLAALAGQGPVPPGFDAERVQASARALAHKRTHAVAHAWPGLTAALGRDFPDRFATYAAAVPLVAQGGPLADGRGFVAWLQAAGKAAGSALGDDVWEQVLAVDLRLTATPTGWLPRRWPCLRAVRLPDAAGWLLGASWPERLRRHGGVRVWQVRLARHRAGCR